MKPGNGVKIYPSTFSQSYVLVFVWGMPEAISAAGDKISPCREDAGLELPGAGGRAGIREQGCQFLYLTNYLMFKTVYCFF